MSGGLHVLPEYNTQERNKDAVMLVDELTSTEYYVGISWNRADQSKPTWRIKRIWKVGTVWHFGFPQQNPKVVQHILKSIFILNYPLQAHMLVKYTW